MYIANWQLITTDLFVLNAVMGYHLDFEEIPFQLTPKRTLLRSKSQQDIVTCEVSKLLMKGAIVVAQLHPQEFVSTVFLVPKKTGDLRPVII